MTRFFRTAAGLYAGAWDGAEPPAGLIEVPQPPADARAIWNGTGWVEPPAPVPATIRVWQMQDELVARGVITSAERLAWAQRGPLPALIAAAIAQLRAVNAALADEVEARAYTMTDLPRVHPLVGVIAAAVDAHGDADAVADEFFREASRR